MLAARSPQVADYFQVLLEFLAEVLTLITATALSLVAVVASWLVVVLFGAAELGASTLSTSYYKLAFLKLTKYA